MLKNIVILGLLLFAVGCGGNKPIPVTGTVTIDGVPIERGTIQLVAADGAGPEGGGVIRDGQFTATVLPGEKIVRVRGRKVVGKKEISNPMDSPGHGKDAKTQPITIDVEKNVTNDRKHWDGSTLKVEVTRNGKPLVIELTN